MLHLEEMVGREDDPSEVNLAFSSPGADAVMVPEFPGGSWMDAPCSQARG